MSNFNAKIINNVIAVPVNKITANPNQPRSEVNTEDIAGLMSSIRSNGLIQPITVRELEGGFYELIAGERRTRSCIALGFEFIPAIVENISIEKSAILALVENIQRKDLDFFEEALAISSLMSTCNLTQDRLAKLIGKSQSSLANKLRILKLSQGTINLIKEFRLTERHARALLALTDHNLQYKATTYICKNNLNVEQSEAYINKLISKSTGDKGSTVLFVSDVRIFFSTVKKAIDFMKTAGIHVDSNQYEDDEYINYLVRIPKVQSVKERTTA